MSSVQTLDHARAMGLKTYFTGKPCRRGHVAPRQTTNMTCTLCVLEMKKVAYALDPSKVKARAKKCRERDNEAYKARARKRWAARSLAERQEIRRSFNERLVTNPKRVAAAKAAVKASKAARRARKSAAEGSFTAQDVLSILAAQRGKCADCKVNVGQKYHADHIIPLALGGTNWPRNIQVLCASCNIRKGAKHPVSWAAELGRLL